MNQSCKLRCTQLFLLGIANLFGLANLLGAEITSYKLQNQYIDFEYDPESNVLFAINAKDNCVDVFDVRQLANSLNPKKTITVGSGPASVFRKQYKGKTYFAVVCSNDSKMYIIYGPEFEQIKRVDLNQTDVLLVTGSQNEEDPFIYYCYGKRRHSTGAISLSDFENKGEVFSDSMDSVFSASGKVAYRRRSGSPNGLQSLILTSQLNESQPTFKKAFYDHKSTYQYLPGPFDQFTAAGEDIFDRSLEKRVAKLDFFPLLFLRKNPVVVGFQPGRGKFDNSKLPIYLQAASYNTFSSVGDVVNLELDALAARDLMRGFSDNRSYQKQIAKQRAFESADGNEVLFASNKTVVIVPLAKFNLPEEPFLSLNVSRSMSVNAGQEVEIDLSPMDKNIEIETGYLPSGMKLDGWKLKWKPAMKQVGTASIAMTLKSGGIQRVQDLTLNVRYPGFRLPFVPGAMAMNPDGTRALIWELSKKSYKDNSSLRVAAIEVKSGEVKAEGTLDGAFKSGVVTDDSAILWNQPSGAKIEVLKLSDLTPRKLLDFRDAIKDVEFTDKYMVVTTSSKVEIIDLKTFESTALGPIPNDLRVQMIRSGTERKSVCRRTNGIFLDHVLYDSAWNRLLITSAKNLAAIPGGSKSLSIPGDFLPRGKLKLPDFNRRTAGFLTTNTPGTGVPIILRKLKKEVRPPLGTRAYRFRFELTLTSGGDAGGSQTVFKELIYDHPKIDPSTVMAATDQQVIVACDQNAFVWSIPGATDPDDPFIPSKLELVAKQSAFSLNEGTETTLTHEVTGGQSPIRFSALRPVDGMEVDADSGAMRIDNAKLTQRALVTLVQKIALLRGPTREKTLVQVMTDNLERMQNEAKSLTGKRLQGIPVAIPIGLTAIDKDRTTSKLEYFVIAEIPKAKLISRLEEEEAEMKKAFDLAKAKADAMREARRKGVQQSQSSSTVEKRLKTLENRIDALSRQMDQVLKKLDALDKAKAPARKSFRSEDKK